MSPTALAIALAVALGGLAVVLNHCYARLALVELTLNEGLPPGHQHVGSSPAPGTGAAGPTSVQVATLLPAGIHVFLSRNCHACQRLVDELERVELHHQSSLHIRYVDRPRPIAESAANRQSAHLHAGQADLAAAVGADPLPFTVAVGAHALVSRAVTPTVSHVLTAARDGGIPIESESRPAV